MSNTTLSILTHNFFNFKRGYGISKTEIKEAFKNNPEQLSQDLYNLKGQVRAYSPEISSACFNKFEQLVKTALR